VNRGDLLESTNPQGDVISDSHRAEVTAGFGREHARDTRREGVELVWPRWEFGECLVNVQAHAHV